MGAAKKDLKTFLKLLDEGYILVNVTGTGVRIADVLDDAGFDVACVYPASLRSARTKWFKRFFDKRRGRK